jgi:hypothetical protein
MASDAQISANRRNAKKSTGPKTAAGLAVASRNALRHGLTAKQLVIRYEEEAADFVSFHDDLRAALAPADAVEEQLVERIVLCSWRLRRVCRAEAGIAATETRNWLGSPRNSGLGKPPAGLIFVAATSEMLALTRYERSIERSLHRALEALERRQEGWRLEAALARREEERAEPPENPFDVPMLSSNPDPYRNARTEEERAEISRRLEINRRVCLGLQSEGWSTQK